MTTFNRAKERTQAFVENNISKAKNVSTAVAFAIVSMVAAPDANAQQLGIRQTDVSGITKIEFFTMANGTDQNTVTGTRSFNNATTDWSIVFIKNNTTKRLAYPTTVSLDNVPQGKKYTISNHEFTNVFGQIGIDQDFSDFANTSGDVVPISVLSENVLLDGIDDGYVSFDAAVATIMIPHTLKDGSPIEIGTRASLKWLDGSFSDIPGLDAAICYLQRNWTTRVRASVDPKGRAIPTYASEWISDATLDTSEFTQEVKKKPMLIQNPVTDSFTYNDGDNNPTEKITYEFYDVTGKIIEKGIGQENQPIPYKNRHDHGVELFLARDEEWNVVSTKTIYQ